MLVARVKFCVAQIGEVCGNRAHRFCGTMGLGDGQADLIILFHLQCLQFCFHVDFSAMEMFILFPVAV